MWVSERLGDAGGDISTNVGERVELAFTPPPGTMIARVRYWRAVAKAADDNWQPYVAVGSSSNVVDTCDMGGGASCQVGGDDWYANDPNDATDRGSYRDLSGLSASELIVGLLCRPNPDNVCGNSTLLVNAQAEIFSAFLTIADPTSPALGTPTGDGWTTTEWAQGTLPLAVGSTDNTGIAATRVYADGSLIATVVRMCSYDRPRPCSDEPSGVVGLPTVGLADGEHGIEVAAVDAAGNETRVARPQALRVDNQAPAAPVGLASSAATSATNSFSPRWTLPADAGSPVVGARYQLCQSGSCGAVQDAPSLTGIDGLVLPAVGSAVLRVWLRDALGHEDPTGAAAAVTLTYAPPPAPLPDAQPPFGGPTPPPDLKPPTVTKIDAALRIASVHRTGRRIAIRGTVSKKASGRVTVRFRLRLGSRTHTLTSHPKIAARAFRTTLTVPRSYAKARKGTATVSYGGDADTRSATRSATVVWRR
jgi:hypothetical protein